MEDLRCMQVQQGQGNVLDKAFAGSKPAGRTKFEVWSYNGIRADC